MNAKFFGTVAFLVSLGGCSGTSATAEPTAVFEVDWTGAPPVEETRNAAVESVGASAQDCTPSYFMYANHPDGGDLELYFEAPFAEDSRAILTGHNAAFPTNLSWQEDSDTWHRAFAGTVTIDSKVEADGKLTVGFTVSETTVCSRPLDNLGDAPGEDCLPDQELTFQLDGLSITEPNEEAAVAPEASLALESGSLCVFE